MLRADEKYFPGRHYVALPFSITHLIVYPYGAVVRAIVEGYHVVVNSGVREFGFVLPNDGDVSSRVI
jgi:hypothetical protein